jgi:hypothetical protein
MIKNRKLFEKFDNEYWSGRKYTLKEKFAIYDGLYEQARRMGVFPLKDPLSGLDGCLNMSEVLNYKVKKHGGKTSKKNSFGSK